MTDDEEYVQGVIESVDSANLYRLQLAELLDGLQEAENQIVTSANTSRNQLRSHFEHLKSCIEAALDGRLKELEEQVDEEEKVAMAPLNECRSLIEQNVKSAKQVLDEGKTLLVGDHQAKRLDMLDFKKKVNKLGFESLPEVPVLADVACISVDLPRDEENAETQLIEAIKEYGRVISHAPVQIIETEERPGAIMVKWMERDDETPLDLAEFRLQYCQGRQKHADCTSVTFQDVYQGPQNSAVVRHLTPSTYYTFRVCGRPEGSNDWCAWSVPCAAVTTMTPYEWQAEQEGYSITTERTVAESTSSAAPVLFSTSQCYICGTSIVFRVLECGEMLSDSNGIALCQQKSGENLISAGTLFVGANGSIYQDGTEKTTRLPALKRGATLTFDTEVLSSGKVRVTIEINEKIVTFDWAINPSCQSESMPLNPISFGFGGQAKEEATQLYFAMKFSQPDWRIRVE